MHKVARQFIHCNYVGQAPGHGLGYVWYLTGEKCETMPLMQSRVSVEQQGILAGYDTVCICCFVPSILLNFMFAFMHMADFAVPWQLPIVCKLTVLIALLKC